MAKIHKGQGIKESYIAKKGRWLYIGHGLTGGGGGASREYFACFPGLKITKWARVESVQKGRQVLYTWKGGR